MVDWQKAVMAFDAGFEESKHDRDEHGRFAAASAGHAAKAAEHKKKGDAARAAGNHGLAARHDKAAEIHGAASTHFKKAAESREPGQARRAVAQARHGKEMAASAKLHDRQIDSLYKAMKKRGA